MSPIDPSALKSYGIDDDPPEVTRVLTEIARAMPAWRKMELVCEMWTTVRSLALAGLRNRYPDADEAELNRRLPALFLPRKTIIEVYGWDPEIEGY